MKIDYSGYAVFVNIYIYAEPGATADRAVGLRGCRAAAPPGQEGIRPVAEATDRRSGSIGRMARRSVIDAIDNEGMRSDVAPADSPDCRHPPGAFRPVVDPRRCEGKAACVAVCPWDVFVVRKFASGERPGLGPLGTVRLWMHGGMQADTVNAQQCHGCGLCVTACPEDAITLQRSGA